MKRYVAFLRGVSPVNAKMPELRKVFESAGFEDVVTVLSSGNVVFSSRAASESSLATKAEGAMKKRLKSAFPTIVRSQEMLLELLESDPFRRFSVTPAEKRIVTFVREPPQKKPKFPIELDGARILSMSGGEIFTVYAPSPRGPVFMTLIERTFGKTVTTRTWDTVGKVAKK